MTSSGLYGEITLFFARKIALRWARMLQLGYKLDRMLSWSCSLRTIYPRVIYMAISSHWVPKMSIFGRKAVFKDPAILRERYMLRKIRFDILKAKKISIKTMSYFRLLFVFWGQFTSENAEFLLFCSFLPLLMHRMHFFGANRETCTGPTNLLLGNNISKETRIT